MTYGSLVLLPVQRVLGTRSSHRSPDAPIMRTFRKPCAGGSAALKKSRLGSSAKPMRLGRMSIFPTCLFTCWWISDSRTSKSRTSSMPVQSILKDNGLAIQTLTPEMKGGRSISSIRQTFRSAASWMFLMPRLTRPKGPLMPIFGFPSHSSFKIKCRYCTGPSVVCLTRRCVLKSLILGGVEPIVQGSKLMSLSFPGSFFWIMGRTIFRTLSSKSGSARPQTSAMTRLSQEVVRGSGTGSRASLATNLSMSAPNVSGTSLWRRRANFSSISFSLSPMNLQTRGHRLRRISLNHWESKEPGAAAC
mmetsp:Transcript_84234/g.238689  ORF Transcript_84234/g.238689 Transcript_84234/m.238689 type:complete len:304 (+) Transcript_84234:678-1589(+)